MLDLSSQLTAFSKGELSAEELLIQVERHLTSEVEDDATVLAAIKEQTRSVPLPPDVRSALELTIYSAILKRRSGLETSSPALVPTPAPNASDENGQLAEAVDDETRMPAGRKHRVAVGDTIAQRFVLKALLGSGGMGQVFKALDIRAQEAQDRQPYVAIKVLNNSFREHPSAFTILQRELKKCLSLTHSNIVRVRDFDRDGDIIFMTMEYLPGHTLEQIIKAPGFNGMPIDEAMDIIRPMAEALVFAHDREFVHSDFKPSNVFIIEDPNDQKIRKDQRVKVIDFGIARAIPSGDPTLDQTVLDISALHLLTPAYASPEMFDGQEADKRDDVYALACVSYELLTGRHPFQRIPASTARAEGLTPKRPRQLDRRQWAGLKQALSFERETRTQDVRAFLECITPQHRIFPRPGLLLIYALFAAGSLAAGYLWLRQESKPRDLATIVSSVPCSLLSATADDNSISVVGYARSAADFNSIEAALRELGGNKSINFNVIQRIDPQHCEAIDLFKPYFTANLTADPGVRIQIQDEGIALHEGEPLLLTIKTASDPSFVFLDYFAVDGTVSHLLPSQKPDDDSQPGQSTLRFGDTDNDGWKARMPYGTQLLVAFSTRRPLFDQPRPNMEPTHEYLEALKNAFDRVGGSEQGRTLADFDFVRVEPNF